MVKISSDFEALSALFMKIGRSAPRFERMALLYPQSAQLQASLQEYFLVVVQLCHRIVKVTSRSMLGQIQSLWAEGGLKSFPARLESWAAQINAEVTLLLAKKIEDEANENSQFRRSLSKAANLVSTRHKLETRVRLLDLCSTFDHETLWKQARRTRNSTVGQNAAYQQWKDRIDSSTIIFTGKLGSGKTVLLANIVDDLSLCAQGYDTLVAYFFCRHDIPESLKERTIIGSFTRQVLRSVRDTSIAAAAFRESETRFCSEAILLPFIEAAALPQNIYFVLDGLDECEPWEASSISKALHQLQTRFSLKVCISLRLEADNASRLRQISFADPCVVSMPDENPDIEAFVEAELESRVLSGALVLRDPRLILDITNTLIKRAQGMFLWVSLQIETLCLESTDAGIRQALDDLPEDLIGTYSRIVKRCKDPKKIYQKTTLELLAVAQRLLTVPEIRMALSVNPGQKDWRPSQMINDIYSVLAYCGSLIIIDEEDSTLRLVHESVKDFLFKSYNDSRGQPLTRLEANRTMADILITYIHYPVFDKTVSTKVARPTIGPDVPSAVARTALGSSKRVQEAALRLLQARKKPSYDLLRLLAEFNVETAVGLDRSDNLQLEIYAKSYLMDHAWCYLWEPKSRMRAMLEQKADAKAFSLDFIRPGPDLPLQSNLTWWPFPLKWSSEEGNALLFKLLVTRSPWLNAEDLEGAAPLLWASKEGHTTVVTQLLERGTVDVNASDVSGRSALLWATQNGHRDIVQQLLNHSQCDIEKRDNAGQLPLSVAISLRRADLVDILVKGGANVLSQYQGTILLLWSRQKAHRIFVQIISQPNLNLILGNLDTFGTLLLVGLEEKNSTFIETVLEKWLREGGAVSEGLFWAAKLDNGEVVKLLLDRGADTGTTDRAMGYTPLMWAAGEGNVKAATALLDGGASPDQLGRYYMTPLSLAAQGGHEAVVRLLLSAGADPNLMGQRSSLQWTALDFAREHGHEHIVELLREKGGIGKRRKTTFKGKQVHESRKRK